MNYLTQCMYLMAICIALPSVNCGTTSKCYNIPSTDQRTTLPTGYHRYESKGIICADNGNNANYEQHQSSGSNHGNGFRTTNREVTTNESFKINNLSPSKQQQQTQQPSQQREQGEQQQQLPPQENPQHYGTPNNDIKAKSFIENVRNSIMKNF